ncbi:DUF3857 domain-containing protein [Edaphobacter aggregans]|uniref:DUF3857 domain-containing protein n=1 Tax=Edaphobacter aggregans TaxID=570835 RepID=UPI000555FB44|nr:DUF3857 domain-containing protein [Edaphobacter aggregans]
MALRGFVRYLYNMRSTAVLSFFALVMLPVSVLGQGSGDGVVTRTLKVELPPGEVKRDYSAESIVVEQLSTVYRFAADGTGVREISAVTLIQSDAAARQYGVLTFPFAGNNERVEFEYVRVRKPDGSVVETPAGDAQEMPQEVTRQAPFYSDLKEKHLPVRNLRAGDRLEYKARIVVAKAEVPGQFWGQESFGKWAVILNENIELHVPKGKYVKVWSPEHAPAKAETGDETVYRWTGANLDPLIGKDGKTKQREVDPKGELPAMAWTTFKSWDEVGAWYRGLEADRVVPDAEVKAKAAELTAGKSTEEEKVRALYGYVATQVRYIGVAFGIGRYQPHPAGEVLRNQYGDCKDKHTLLAAMLTAAGMHPEAAMIGAGIRMNEEVPSPGAFNHMITTVPVTGQQVWLDATAEVAPYQVLVSPIRDKQALVVPETGAAKLERTPATPPFAPFSRFVAKGTLSKEGTMKAQMEYMVRGDDELVLRTLLKQVPPGQWDELTQRLSQGLGFGGTTSHTEASKPDATDGPERLAYDYEREKTGDWDNRRIVALLPVVFLPTIDEKNPPKKVAIQLGEPRVETSVSTIKLPAGWGADLPAAVHEKTAFASFDRTYTVNGDTLTTERRIEVFQREVPAADWKAYKKWLDATVGDGEPFVTLIETKAKTGGEKLPSTPAPPSVSVAALLREFYNQVQRGEPNAAEETLNQVRQQDGGAIWYFRGMVTVHEMRGKPEEAADAMRRVLKMDGVTDGDRKVTGALLYQLHRYDEALPLLQEQAKDDTDNLQLQIQLGTAQVETGRKEAGGKTLTAALSKATEPFMLNDAAYELGEAGIGLEQAEKASRQAIQDLTAESASWVVSATTKEQRSKQELLVSAWDTLGWILFREGRIDEAESYIRATWNNEQTPEVGLHLGELEDKRGNKKAALELYEMSLTPIIQKTTSTPEEERTRRELRERTDALKKEGVVSAMKDPAAAVQRLRMIPLGPWRGKSSSVEYTFVLEQDKPGDLQETSQGASGITNATSMIRKARFDHWTPTGSEARLLRKSTLNCHASVCELVVHPM